MNRLFYRISKRVRSERGVATIEYIALAATVLVLLGSVIWYIDTTNGGPIGPAISEAMGRMVLALERPSAAQPGTIRIDQPEIVSSGGFGPGGIEPGEIAQGGLGTSDTGPGGAAPGGIEPGQFVQGGPGPDGASAVGIVPAVSGPGSTGGGSTGLIDRMHEACPSCGRWLEHALDAAWSATNPWDGSYQSVSELTRLFSHGAKYVVVREGAPPDLRPGRYLASNPKVALYTTPGGAFKHSLTSGSGWIAGTTWSVLSTAIDYRTGFFNPENKGKPIISTEFGADVSVGLMTGMLSGAAASAIVTKALLLAGITTLGGATLGQILLVVLASIVVAKLLLGLVDLITAYLTGKAATEWLKEWVQGGLDQVDNWIRDRTGKTGTEWLRGGWDWVVDRVKNSWDAVKGLVGA